MHAVNSIRC